MFSKLQQDSADYARDQGTTPGIAGRRVDRQRPSERLLLGRTLDRAIVGSKNWRPPNARSGTVRNSASLRTYENRWRVAHFSDRKRPAHKG